jgi:hypothetical protein
MPSSAFGSGRVLLDNRHAYPGSGLANAYGVVPVLPHNADLSKGDSKCPYGICAPCDELLSSILPLDGWRKQPKVAGRSQSWPS